MATTYSFLNVVASLSGPGGNIDLGAGASLTKEGISYQWNQSQNTMTVGADGKGTHTLHADRSGQIMVRLLKTSPQNALLNQMRNTQQTSASLHGQNTIVIRDTARGDVVTATSVAFAARPPGTYGDEQDTKTWAFDAVDITETLGSGDLIAALS